MSRLPNKLLAIPNRDKGFHEKWKENRNLLNFPHPWRMVCFGPPNCGKSTTIKNIIIRADPPFEKVYVIHCDVDGTKEYEDIGAEMLYDIPSPEEWPGEEKTLVILDDLEYKNMTKQQKSNLDRLFGYVSTHKNVSCALCAQDAFNIPAIVRRCANVYVLWRMSDTDSMATCARRTGMKSQQFKHIFNSIMPDPHDSLWIDMTSRTPAPVRKNGFEILRSDKAKEDKRKKLAEEFKLDD
jgi:replication-associated recombination protein RarA